MIDGLDLVALDISLKNLIGVNPPVFLSPMDLLEVGGNLALSYALRKEINIARQSEANYSNCDATKIYQESGEEAYFFNLVYHMYLKAPSLNFMSETGVVVGPAIRTSRTLDHMLKNVERMFAPRMHAAASFQRILDFNYELARDVFGVYTKTMFAKREYADLSCQIHASKFSELLPEEQLLMDPKRFQRFLDIQRIDVSTFDSMRKTMNYWYKNYPNSSTPSNVIVI